MKMMKTDMEFVTFDAQDVIATSGPVPTGISFKVTSSLFDLDTGWQHSYDSYWVSTGFGDFAIKDSNGHSLTEGQYYTIAEGANYAYTFNNNGTPDDTYTGSLTFNSGLTAGNTGAEEKTSLKEILGWLGVQNIIQ